MKELERNWRIFGRNIYDCLFCKEFVCVCVSVCVCVCVCVGKNELNCSVTLKGLLKLKSYRIESLPHSFIILLWMLFSMLSLDAFIILLWNCWIRRWKDLVNYWSANPTKWSNALKLFVGFSWWIVWVCLTILWSLRLKG